MEYEQVGMEEAVLPPVYLLVYKRGDVLLGYPGFKIRTADFGRCMFVVSFLNFESTVELYIFSTKTPSFGQMP